MRRSWAVAGAIVLGATVFGGLVAGCEKHRERVKVIEVRPQHDRNVHIDRDRREHDRDWDRRGHDRDREIRKESRRDN